MLSNLSKVFHEKLKLYHSKNKTMQKLNLLVVCILIALLNYSCYKTKSPLPEPGEVRLSVKQDKELDIISKALGREYICSYDIDLNTANNRSVLYSAVLEVDQENINPGIRLVCYKLFNNDYMGKSRLESDDTTYVKKQNSYDLLFDKQMPKYLNNNKTYFSLQGEDVNEVCLEGNIWNKNIPGNYVLTITDGFPVRLFSGRITNPNHSTEEERQRFYTTFNIGFLTYNKRQGMCIDFNAYFDDEEVKYFLSNALPLSDQSMMEYEHINVSNFEREVEKDKTSFRY